MKLVIFQKMLFFNKCSKIPSSKNQMLFYVFLIYNIMQVTYKLKSNAFLYFPHLQHLAAGHM